MRLGGFQGYVAIMRVSFGILMFCIGGGGGGIPIYGFLKMTISRVSGAESRVRRRTLQLLLLFAPQQGVEIM